MQQISAHAVFQYFDRSKISRKYLYQSIISLRNRYMVLILWYAWKPCVSFYFIAKLKEIIIPERRAILFNTKWSSFWNRSIRFCHPLILPAKEDNRFALERINLNQNKQSIYCHHYFAGQRVRFCNGFTKRFNSAFASANMTSQLVAELHLNYKAKL